MNIAALRREYHLSICQEIIRVQHGRSKDDSDIGYLNFADVTSPASINIAWGVVKCLSYEPSDVPLAFSASARFGQLTRLFLEKAFGLLSHIRPGDWVYSAHFPISDIDQYHHLAGLEEFAELATILGTDYIITPDIVVGRQPISDQEINRNELLIAPEDHIATYTRLRQSNADSTHPIFHASISCKWTLRSDRGQPARTEALNLVGHRKEFSPHIVVVTAEPMPWRIAPLALGTGDLDCTYHFALHELQETIAEIGSDDQKELLQTLIIGKRLRDISDSPFDLAI